MQAKVVVILSGILSCVTAGGPAAYSISVASVDSAFVGSSHENTIKGLYGQNSQSVYSKAVDSAHSSVRVSSSRISNDILSYAPHYGGHLAAPAYTSGINIAAPAYNSGNKIAAPAIAPLALAAPAIAPLALAAPTVSAPDAVKLTSTPNLISGYGHGYGHAYGVGYGHGYGHTYGVGYAPTHHYGASIPSASFTYSSVPLAYRTSIAAAPVVHTTFLGHGAHYAY